MQHMKRLSFVCVFLLSVLFTNAQFFQIAEGPVFPDTSNGYAKILQMKNGVTMFLLVNFKSGITVHVYESKYHAKTETVLTPNYGQLANGSVDAIFEINGDAVLMISNANEAGRTLYRLIVDGVTGKLKDEKRIGMLRSYSEKKANGKSLLLQSDIYARKDPASDNYAVALVNPVAIDSATRIEIICFGSDNRETAHGYFPTLEKFQQIRYVDMAVIGSGKAEMLLYGSNTKDKGEQEGDMILASVVKGANTIALKELNFSSDLVVQNGIARYDPETKKMIVLFTANVKSESNENKPYYTFVDVENKSMDAAKLIEPGKVIEDRFEQVFGKRATYKGFPQNLFINDDRTFTVLFEDLDIIKSKDSVHTMIKNISVVTYNTDGEQVSSYFIPVSHDIVNSTLPVFYQSQRDIAVQQVSNKNQYKGVKYISDGHNSFIMFNDNGSNDQGEDNGKITPLTDTNYADAYYYQLTGKFPALKRKYMFGKPAGMEQHRPAFFGISDYDKANNVLVVLKVEKEGAHGGVHLVWLQP